MYHVTTNIDMKDMLDLQAHFIVHDVIDCHDGFIFCFDKMDHVLEFLDKCDKENIEWKCPELKIMRHLNSQKRIMY